jgi:hypothetical protein
VPGTPESPPRRRIRFLALSLLVAGWGTAADPAPAADSPESAILAPIQALRQNDVLAIFKALPDSDQQEAEKSWAENQAKPPGSPEDAKVDQTLMMLGMPNAVDMLMLQVEPKLKEVDPNQLAFQIQMGAGMVGMMLAQKPEGMPFAEAIQGIATDLVAWLPKSGINDPAKAREALTQVVAAVNSYEIKDSAGLRALSLNEVLDRTGKALKQLKQGFAVYGCDLDAFLDSVEVKDVKTEGDKATGTLQFVVLGKPRTLPLKLVRKDGRWVGDESMLAPLQQMQGGGPENAQPTTDGDGNPAPGGGTVPLSPEPVAP